MQYAHYILLSGVSLFAASEHIVPDEICGPRAVHSVLALYGYDDSLLKLVTEIQPSGPESSLYTLAQALSDRGISSRALRITTMSDVALNGPAIVHVTGTDGRGHFIALEPTSSSGVFVVWDGLNGVYRATAEEVDALSPDIILFTSKGSGDLQDESIHALKCRAAIRWALCSCVPLAVAAAVTIRPLFCRLLSFVWSFFGRRSG
jgi:ABC-type bacteriocin/lantibiotic exporter with double-glycine peptidase domain